MCFYETQHPIQQEAQSSAPHSSPLLPNALPQDVKVPPAKSDHSSILAHAPSTLGESNLNPSPELQAVCPGAQGRNLLEGFWVQQPESNSCHRLGRGGTSLLLATEAKHLRIT